MEKMDEKFEQMLGGAIGVFMKYGIRSVTMDDMARQLGVSKKTLYKYVTDKSDLVKRCMAFQHEQEHCALGEVMKKGLNAIDENFEVSRFIAEQIKNIHPSVMYDIEKYYPEVKQEFNHYKKETVYGWVVDNMERGIKEGLFRDDLNVPILAAAYIQRMDDLFDEEAFPSSQFKTSEVYLELFRYHIRGLASEKGIEYLKQKVKQESKKIS
jgi:AcrR family transcriptional regulator